MTYLTAALVLITAIYAYLTHRIAKASEASVRSMADQLEAANRPYVTVAPIVRPHTPFLYLRITNSGKSAAENVRLTIDRDFYAFGNKSANLREASAFAMPIDSMAPGMELRFGLGQGWLILGDKAEEERTPPQFSVTATYSFFGKSVTETTKIDLRPYAKAEPERDPVVEELELIRKILDKKLQ